jgi:hypothetical protein
MVQEYPNAVYTTSERTVPYSKIFNDLSASGRLTYNPRPARYIDVQDVLQMPGHCPTTCSAQSKIKKYWTYSDIEKEMFNLTITAVRDTVLETGTEFTTENLRKLLGITTLDDSFTDVSTDGFDWMEPYRQTVSSGRFSDQSLLVSLSNVYQSTRNMSTHGRDDCAVDDIMPTVLAKVLAQFRHHL